MLSTMRFIDTVSCNILAHTPLGMWLTTISLVWLYMIFTL